MNAMTEVTNAVLLAVFAAIFLEATSALAILAMRLTERTLTVSISMSVTLQISAELMRSWFAQI